MSDPLGDLAKDLLPARTVAYVNGTTTGAPSSGVVQVNIGGQVVPAHVPGSFRNNVTTGQNVRLARQQNTYVVDSILDAIAAPDVAAPPSASTVSPLNMTDALGFTAAGFSNSGFTSQDFQAALYAEYVKDELNDAIDVINDHEDTITSLKATVNSLRTSLAELRTALIDQGYVSAP